MSTGRKEEMDQLDRELAQMAQEAPEMPEDFHARWTAQVRAEAQQAKTLSRKEGRRQWRYILSAAAVFVFLIGGTVLTRSIRQGRSAVGAQVQEKKAAAVLLTGAEAPATEAVPLATSAPTAPAPLAASAPMAEEPAVMTEAEAPAAASGAAEQESGGAPVLFAMKSAAREAEETRTEGTADAGADAAWGENSLADVEDALAETVTEEVLAEEDTTETGPGLAEETGAEPEPAEEETAEITGGDGFGGFMKDLGIFTLWTAGIALGGGALAFLAAALWKVIRKKK